MRCAPRWVLSIMTVAVAVLSEARAWKMRSKTPALLQLHEAVVERLVGSVTGGRVAPLQPIADDVDDATDDLSVIDARDAAPLVG